MPSLARVKLRWSGFQGAPGFSIFHFRDFDQVGQTPETAAAAAAAVDNFALAIQGLLPAAAQLQVETDVESIDEATGELQDVYSVPAKPIRSNNAAAGISFAGPVGAVVNWRTNQVRNGRRMRGKTFIVPIVSSKFEANGTLHHDTINTLTAAALALRTDAAAPSLGVYGRPTKEAPASGVFAPASSHSIPDMAAVLRSRRD